MKGKLFPVRRSFQRRAGTGTPAAAQQASQPTAQPPRIIELTLAFIAPHFRPDPIVLRVGEPVQFQVSSADTRHSLVIGHWASSLRFRRSP
jgi:hypothetical protein